jgi:hypothetical protein
MSKKFNYLGPCKQNEHYMADISGRIDLIASLISDGLYFHIQKGRQYGKTTTLQFIRNSLSQEYLTFYISLESFAQSDFADYVIFFQIFFSEMLHNPCVHELEDTLIKKMDRIQTGKAKFRFNRYGRFLSDICSKSKKPVVLMLDEVDSASDSDVFLSFLGMLR